MFSSFDSLIRGFCWCMLAVLCVGFFIGCESKTFSANESFPEPMFESSESSPVSFDEGGTVPIIQMPFEFGHVSQCTQGVNGTTSHHSTSTMYDIDFDTSNTIKEELRAPVSGIAYVHTEDASKNFGYHVCIDLGNGTYVILGHMSDIAVSNGEQVVAGQYVGHEGCTGYCSGDHVHVGLHVGDARKMGQYGVSVPVRYVLADQTMNTQSVAMDSSLLVCGIKAFGDKVNGHFYVSQLDARAVAQTNKQNQTPPNSNSTPSSSQPQVQQPKTSNNDVWVNDMGLDGIQETLMMNAARWIDPVLSFQDAFVWGTGGCFDTQFSSADLVHPENGYFQIDFSSIKTPCMGTLTLISAKGTDGNPPNFSMTNWNWWQNQFFCSKGSAFCNLQNNGQAWEEWMIRVSWDPVNGLSAAGNGFTSNAQLK